MVLLSLRACPEELIGRFLEFLRNRIGAPNPLLQQPLDCLQGPLSMLDGKQMTSIRAKIRTFRVRIEASWPS